MSSLTHTFYGALTSVVMGLLNMPCLLSYGGSYSKIMSGTEGIGILACETEDTIKDKIMRARWWLGSNTVVVFNLFRDAANSNACVNSGVAIVVETFHGIAKRFGYSFDQSIREDDGMITVLIKSPMIKRSEEVAFLVVLQMRSPEDCMVKHKVVNVMMKRE